jgi:nickel-dependent lactate racemase
MRQNRPPRSKHTPESFLKHAPESFLKLVGQRAADGVPIEVWSEVAKFALVNRVTTGEVLMTALTKYLGLKTWMA